MSIYTPGMKKPKTCYDCVFCKQGFCYRLRKYVVYPTAYSDNRDENCPLVELSPHGRLIDVDAFIAKLESAPKRYSEDTVYPLTFKDWFDAIIYELQSEKSTPTIIPAEEAQECSEN